MEIVLAPMRSHAAISHKRVMGTLMGTLMGGWWEVEQI